MFGFTDVDEIVSTVEQSYIEFYGGKGSSRVIIYDQTQGIEEISDLEVDISDSFPQEYSPMEYEDDEVCIALEEKDYYIHYSFIDNLKIKTILSLMKYINNDRTYEKLWNFVMSIKDKEMKDGL